MKLFKNKNMKYLFVGIIVILIFFIGAIKIRAQEQVIDPITYDFNNDSILDVDQENEPYTYNIREQTEYTQNYFGYESFDYNDISELISKPNVEVSDSNDFSIVENHIGHDNVLKLVDDDFADVSFMWYNFSQPSTLDTIEIWNNLNTTETFYILIVDSGTDSIYIQFSDTGVIRYYDGSYHTLQTYLVDCWYHLSIDYNILTTWNLTINGILYESLGFRDNPSSFKGIYLGTTNVAVDLSVYIDGLDFSWDNLYYENRNLLPTLENTGYYEVDKYEFNYKPTDFEGDLTHWIQTEKDGVSNDIYIDRTNDVYNNLIMYSFYGSIYTQYVNYQYDNSDAMIMNFTFSLEPSSLSNNDFTHDIIIKPKNFSGSTDYIKFKFVDLTQDFQIFNQSTDTYETKFTYISEVYDINIYINYYDNVLIYRINSDTVNVVYVYDFDLDNRDLYGLADFYLFTFCSETTNPSSFEITYYSIGIYENGKSVLRNNYENEFGLMIYQIWSTWNSDSHNLITIDCNNDYRLYTNEYDVYFKDGYKIRERNNQTESETINLADSLDNNYPKFIKDNPKLIFQVFGNCTNTYEIEIEGIQLIDNELNVVYGNYYYNNSNSNNNWFYAVDNKLFYHFNNSIEPYIETMRITFNVYDILLDNESLISYSSYISNNYSGQIRVSSYYNSEVFNISESESLENTYLNMTDTEHFTLKEISIEVYTNTDSNDLPRGYIQNINVYPEKPLFPDFDPITYLDSTFLEKMLETIIPMLFFIIPALIMKTRYGSKAVLPIWILMTFVFMIANFIPFWICFIIFLSIGLMLINKDEVIE